MKRLIYIFFFFFTDQFLFAQNSEFTLQNYHPVSPTAFQFQRYDQIPISEYTGAIDIPIPLYTISEDGLSIPLNLNYHSSGIRVNQESSWVGLGWDLQIGSIIQEVNDKDDYDPNTVQMLPDFHDSPLPSAFPYRYSYPDLTVNGSGWSNPYPIEPVQPHHSYKYSTAFYMPINGDFDNSYNGQQVASNPYYDSEPDIFKASFLGHTISFIKLPNSNTIKVLNSDAYSVQRIGSTYKIIAPTSEEFYFEQSIDVQSYSQTFGGITGSSNSDNQVVSRIWVLTKIITRNKRQISFNYTQTALSDNYPSYSEKWDQLSLTGTVTNTNPNVNMYTAYSSNVYSGNTESYSFSKENRIYLSSISFPNGRVSFSISDRNDLLGGKKLDGIQVTNSNNLLIKSFQFNYAYFDGSSVGGNGYAPSNNQNFGNTYKLRLKLLSIQDNTGAIHSFTYNNTLLPAKNSLAQDFWGFYNGQLNNSSIIPNPIRLNKSPFNDNGTNNSANLSYAQACILTDIDYPTGGRVSFEYELNQFDNYWVPDFNNTTNQISSGNGLRLQAIYYKADGTNQAKKTTYTYVGGKATLTLNMYRQYSINSAAFSGQSLTINSYSVDEFCAKGFFSSNSLGSLNGVGYDKVIKRDIDLVGNSMGRTETEYYNVPDIVSTTVATTSQLSGELPAIKDLNSTNGSVKTIFYFKEYFDNQNILQSLLLKKIDNTYTTISSDYFYGARIFGYTNLIYAAALNSQTPYWVAAPQTFIGYFPIYDTKSLLNQTTTTQYDENGNTSIIHTAYGYDGYDQLAFKQIGTSTGGYLEENYDHAYDYYQQTNNNLLWSNHILTEVTGIRSTRRQSNYGMYTNLYKYNKQFISSNGIVLPSSVTIYNHPDASQIPKVVTYDSYDSYANPNQITSEGKITSMLWDYNNELLIAEVNGAATSQIAYTSFEADGKGNWSYSGIPAYDNFAPTGKKVYSLTNGNISKSNLDASKSFIVSYWSNSGVQSVSGSMNSQSGSTYNGWTYYEHLVTNTSSVTISGGGTIDELRLYEKGGMMSTFTYEPLLGITSQCDANNKIVYYQYDGANRLSLIRDANRNILKKYCYNYSGQTESCPFNP